MAKKKTAATKSTSRRATSKPAKTASATKAAPRPKSSARAKTPDQIQAAAAKLDLEILKLINQRAQLSIDWIESHDDPRQFLFSPRLEDEAITRMLAKNAGPLSTLAVSGVMRHVFSGARRKVRMQRVAYLGPAFSYSHQASIERFGEAADLIPVSTIASVFEEVNRGHAEFGIVPIENSTDGRIVDTLDMFTRLPLRICGEVQLSVNHNLLARCARSQITEIYSKPQAFSQCRNWLNRHMPHARLHDVTSTSTAAQLARDKPGAAAIASGRAAVEYGLEVVAADVQDNKNNVTRFAIIGDHVPAPTGSDRTALLLQIPHKPGALSDALVAFKNHKVNLSWIESFPLRGPEAGYLFFLDFEGHQSEAKVKRTLEHLAKSAVRMEVLGSFPRSEVLP
ncbi:MAG: prephenate dehydratase [Planctomycetota bacterium]|jgi:chorismate mutase/prephenate dehydratase|nr:prephenate dehydratase [Planctomycetota bacterium]MDA0918694.1 prephenate dehydratase [Planctomycetota bacterium]